MSRKKIAATLLVILLLIYLLVVWAVITAPGAMGIQKYQVTTDLAQIVMSSAQDRYTDLMSRAYLVAQEYDEDTPTYEVIYSHDNIRAEVWIDVPGTPIGDIWVILYYDGADTSLTSYKLYDYGYITK